MPALTVHNAQIKTAAVEVKTLTISGKQVTLAVFRQLREMPLIDFEGALNGVPWGTVNYHPDKCGGDGEATHLHVVWQLGAELRRSRVDKPYFDQPIHAESAEKWLDAALLDGWRPKGDKVQDKLFVSFDDVGKTRVLCDMDVRNAVWPDQWYSDPESQQRLRDRSLERIRERVTGSRDELQKLVEAEIGEEAQFRQRHQARWAEVSDLPQLFIAV